MRVGPQHDGRRDVFAQGGVRDGKGYGFRDCRMFEQRFVDFPRSYFLPTAIDHFPHTARQKQVSVLIEKALVAGLEPIARKRRLCRDRIAVVAWHDARAADGNLASLATRQRCPSFVHDRNIQLHRYADRARLALARRHRITCDRCGSSFRHAVKLDHRGLEGSFQFREDGRRQRRRRGAYETKATVGCLLTILSSLGENCLMHGRHRGVPCRAKVA